MAEASQGSRTGGPLGDPPENTFGTLIPHWLMSHDEIGYQIVLVLQARQQTPSDSQENNFSLKRLPSPFIIGASVEQLIGRQEARKVNATKENRGTKYLLRTDARSIAEKLLTLTVLVDGTQVEVFAHNTLNSVQGIVYELDTVNDDEQEILKHLESQGVTNVRRIRKRVNNVLRNTPLLVLTLKGAVLPQTIFFGLLRVPIRTYYPSPLLCYNCGVYGHSKNVCKGTSICLNCSKESHVAKGEQCQNPPFCLHCKNDHSIISRDCPTYQHEKKIIHHKIDNRVSFGEARRVLNENQKDTYASALQHRLHQVELEKDTIIRNLRNELEAVKAEMEHLKTSLRAQSTNIVSQNIDISPPTITCSTPPADQTPSMPEAVDNPETNGNQINGRKSRKDKASMSPPKAPPISKTQSTLQTMKLRNRSRSDKRTNASPPDIDYDPKAKRRHLTNNDGCK